MKYLHALRIDSGNSQTALAYSPNAFELSRAVTIALKI